VDEQVGIVGRLADQRQHAAIPDVDGHHRAAAPVQSRDRCGLHVDIERQAQVLPRHRRRLFQYPQFTSLGIDLDLLQADLAMQQRLVRLLHPELADMGRAAVVDRVEGLQLLDVDTADVAEGVGQCRAVGVVAVETRLHVDAGEAVTADCQPGQFVVGQAETERQALEVRLARRQLAKALEIAVGNLDQLAEGGERGLHVIDQFGSQLQAEGRQVLRQATAVAVDDQATGRHQRLDLDPVVLRQFLVVGIADHLQPGQSSDQGGKQQADHHQCQDGPVERQLALMDVVLDGELRGHGYAR